MVKWLVKLVINELMNSDKNNFLSDLKDIIIKEVVEIVMKELKKSGYDDEFLMVVNLLKEDIKKD